MKKSNSNLETISQIKDILTEHYIWLSVAESLTCGKLQSNLGEVSGISQCFKGGITAYTIDEKVNFLKVDRQEAEKVNSVSQSIAHQMAEGVSLMFDSGIGISTTGYAEQYENHDPHAFFAIYMKKNNAEGTIIIDGRINAEGKNRTEFQIHIVDTIFNKLLTYLINHSETL